MPPVRDVVSPCRHVLCQDGLVDGIKMLPRGDAFYLDVRTMLNTMNAAAGFIHSIPGKALAFRDDVSEVGGGVCGWSPVVVSRPSLSCLALTARVLPASHTQCTLPAPREH